jgi:hypothetical protein
MSPRTAAGVGAAVRWGCGAHAFELRASNAEILGRADVVFRPWKAPIDPVATHTWTLGDRSDGRWSLETGEGEPVEVLARSNAAVRRVESLAVQTIFDGPPDVPTAHAALVARSGRGVLITGVQQTGKSTLACALWQRGFSLLGDDVALLDLDRFTAVPAPRRVSLRESSRALVGEAVWTRIQRAPSSEPSDEGYVFHPGEIDGSPPGAVAIAAVVFLGRRGADPAGGLRRLPPAHAALGLLPAMNLARRLDVGTFLSALTPFITAVPAYDLGRTDLGTMTAAIDGMLDP